MPVKRALPILWGLVAIVLTGCAGRLNAASLGYIAGGMGGMAIQPALAPVGAAVLSHVGSIVDAWQDSTPTAQREEEARRDYERSVLLDQARRSNRTGMTQTCDASSTSQRVWVDEQSFDGQMMPGRFEAWCL